MENKIKELEEKLLRKEQECERLKKANDEKNELLIKLGCPTTATAKRKIFCLQQQLDQLKAENEELKKDYITAKSMYDLCQSDFMELAKIKDKYKQTLAEIKDIAELKQKQSVFVGETVFEQVLQKISECEVGNEQN